MKEDERKKILIVGEHLTPSHVVRPILIAETLRHQYPHYEIHLAVPSVPAWMNSVQKEFLHLLPSPHEDMLKKRVNRVILPLYTQSEISRMVDAECTLLTSLRPDLVVHDFRNTLAISTAVTGIPLISLNDFYWNESYTDTHIMPDTPLSSIIGHARARAIAQHFAPIVESSHIMPFNKVARQHGVAPFENLRHFYNSSKEQWLFDIPEVLPHGVKENTHFVGPLQWECDVPLPPWLHDIQDKSAICVTFSSSGSRKSVEKILDAIGTLNVPIIVLTAGKYTLAPRPHVYVSAFAPMRAVLAKSRVFICTGGSSLAYHALTAKVPVVGIPQNITQWYSMHQFERMGMGTLVPAEEAEGIKLQEKVMASYEDKYYEARTIGYRESCTKYEPFSRIGAHLCRVLR